MSLSAGEDARAREREPRTWRGAGRDVEGGKRVAEPRCAGGMTASSCLLTRAPEMTRAMFCGQLTIRVVQNSSTHPARGLPLVALSREKPVSSSMISRALYELVQYFMGCCGQKEESVEGTDQEGRRPRMPPSGPGCAKVERVARRSSHSKRPCGLWVRATSAQKATRKSLWLITSAQADRHLR